MSRSPQAPATVIELGPRLQPLKEARRPGNPPGTVIVLKSASPAPPAADAQAHSPAPDAARHGLDRTLGFLRRLFARIDLSDFPGSCCG